MHLNNAAFGRDEIPGEGFVVGDVGHSTGSYLVKLFESTGRRAVFDKCFLLIASVREQTRRLYPMVHAEIPISIGICLFCEVGFRWRAHRIKPSADVDFGVGLPAEVACSGCTGRGGVPFENGKFGIAALDHKPVIGAAGDPTADFTSVFLKRCHV